MGVIHTLQRQQMTNSFATGLGGVGGLDAPMVPDVLLPRYSLGGGYAELAECLEEATELSRSLALPLSGCWDGGGEAELGPTSFLSGDSDFCFLWLGLPGGGPGRLLRIEVMLLCCTGDLSPLSSLMLDAVEPLALVMLSGATISSFPPSRESGGLGGRPVFSCSSRSFICLTATSNPTRFSSLTESPRIAGGAAAGLGAVAGFGSEFFWLNLASTLFILSLKLLRALLPALTSDFGSASSVFPTSGSIFDLVGNSEGLMPAAAALAAKVFAGLEAPLPAAVEEFDSGEDPWPLEPLCAALDFRNSLYS